MKKNVTINLSNRLFQIDEDAYEMLQQYISSLRTSFGRQEGGDEIVDDIEARIAELFEEIKEQGSAAITIDHVKDIITRIGEPEQITGENAEEQGKKSGETSRPTESKSRKFFRNPNDKIIAGVLSGLSNSIGGDVLYWRLGYLALAFFSGYVIAPILMLLFHMKFVSTPFFVILYIILAILMPEAKTPEQQLQMKRKPITPQNIADEVVDNKKEKRGRGIIGNIFSILIKMIFGFFVGILSLICLALCLGLLFVTIATIVAIATPISDDPTPFSIAQQYVVCLWDAHPFLIIALFISLLTFTLLSTYSIFRVLFSYGSKSSPMSTNRKIALVITWIVAFCCAMSCCIPVARHCNAYFQKLYVEEHTYQGALMMHEDRDYLKRNGWILLKHDNCHDRYTSAGQYFTGDNNRRYLDTWNRDCSQIYQAEKHMAITEPGTYRITCHGRAEGHGVYIYASQPSAGHNPIAKAEITPYGYQSGELWEIAPPESNVRQANDGTGYGWSEITMTVNINNTDSLFYGVSTDPRFTGEPHNSQWFSVCDFEVEKIN
ncbi:MAG: PspC domain-containing protein [Bacteroidales bacterium]|nr:PspC domain-containing protein [Bacteroidales bacterium]